MCHGMSAHVPGYGLVPATVGSKQVPGGPALANEEVRRANLPHRGWQHLLLQEHLPGATGENPASWHPRTGTRPPALRAPGCAGAPFVGGGCSPRPAHSCLDLWRRDVVPERPARRRQRRAGSAAASARAAGGRSVARPVPAGGGRWMILKEEVSEQGAAQAPRGWPARPRGAERLPLSSMTALNNCQRDGAINISPVTQQARTALTGSPIHPLAPRARLARHTVAPGPTVAQLRAPSSRCSPPTPAKIRTPRG